MKTVTLAACSVVLGFVAVSACGGSAQGPAGGIASGSGGDSGSSGKGGGTTGGSAGKGGSAGRGGSSGSSGKGGGAGKGGGGVGGGAGSGTGGSSGGGAVAGNDGQAGDLGNAGETSGGSAGTGGAAGRGGSGGSAGATGGSGGSSADCEITTDVVGSCALPASSDIGSCAEYHAGSGVTADIVQQVCDGTEGAVFSAGPCGETSPDALDRIGCCVTPGTDSRNCYYGASTSSSTIEQICELTGCGFTAG